MITCEQTAWSSPVCPARRAAASGTVVGSRRTSRAVPSSRSRPNVVSTQEASGSTRSSSYVSGAQPARTRSARTLAAPSTRSSWVTRRRVSPITRSAVTSLPNNCVATRATSARCSLKPCPPAIVAEVPMHCRLGVSQASRTRRTSNPTSAIAVQLIQHEEAQPTGGLDQVPALPRPQEHQLEHHVVGEDDVGRRAEDPLALLVGLLTGVPGEGHRRVPFGKTVLEELLQLAELAVGKRVHGIHDDRSNALAAALSQDAVNDRHEIAQALAGARARGEHVAPSGSGNLDSLALVEVEDERRPRTLFRAALDSKDPPAPLVQDTGVDEFVDGAARLEAGVEGEPRVRPSQPTRELLIDIGADALVANLQKAPGKRLVVFDEPITNVEDVQASPQVGSSGRNREALRADRASVRGGVPCRTRPA